MSKQDAAEEQVAEQALAAVKAGLACVDWGVKADVEMFVAPGPWGHLKMPDGTVVRPGQTYPLDTGMRHYEVTIRWTE